MDAGNPIERECERCSYEMSSATAGSGSARWRVPSECPECGGDLVTSGAGADEDAVERDHDLSPEEVERIETDPVLQLSDVVDGANAGERATQIARDAVLMLLFWLVLVVVFGAVVIHV